MARFAGWIVALGMLAGGMAVAVAAEAPAAKAGPKRAEFDKVFSEWKKVLGDLRQLKLDYAKAQPTEKAPIEAKYADLLKQAAAMLPKLVPMAEEAYAEDPEQGGELARFLIGAAFDYCARDDYDTALQIATFLQEKKVNEPILPAVAGWAQFATGDFDAAATNLAAAAKSEILEKNGGRIGNADLMTWKEDVKFLKDAWEKEKKIREAEAKANDLPRVLLKTTKGDIEVELFENQAPNTAANFISLVEQGYYNDNPFHRVLPQFMAQTGGGREGRGPGYTVPCECYRDDYRVHFRGALSMALPANGRDKGSSGFFITFLPTHHLDGKHTVFGRVIKGFDVLARIQKVDPQRPSDVQPDKILEAKVLRKRDHKYEVKKSGKEEP
jgi:cyclophilin family peptidyl-prolyl cis-trans isomerase